MQHLVKGRGPAHGVPGGRLPQHLRVLGGPRGHLPHRRRPVHPALRLLPDRHRQARSRSTATSRAGSPSPCRRWSCATPPSPGSPATTCPTAAPGSTPRRSGRSTSSTPSTGVEILSPTSRQARPARARSSTSRPEVFAHNVETVPRIFKRHPPGLHATRRSLDGPDRRRATAGLVTKSNLILGHGRDPTTRSSEALRDLHDAGCDILTITQYLRPSPRHHPIDRWVKPEEFVRAGATRPRRSGSPGVMSGPLVRSSYRAGRLWATAMRRWGRPIPEHLSHLAEAASDPARQEASALVARARGAVS